MSRVQFEVAKISFIHFIHYKVVGKDSAIPLQIKGKEIAPINSIKILGVTLDKELWFKTHLVDKASKATKVTLALYRLKGLQPKVVKQLTQNVVLPVADYALPIWYSVVIYNMKQLLK
jgi:hypothetical protein